MVKSERPLKPETLDRLHREAQERTRETIKVSEPGKLDKKPSETKLTP
jgi:hypothetical protein